jgi:NAD(P)-dependent dehydrogenase (short-subunit alcohol dehydrogenase family)
MGLLDNKVAFITGAASGIGAETARRFAQEGAHVVLADVQVTEGTTLQQEIEETGKQAFFVECDVASPEAVERAITATVEKYGRLDIVFANAGINGVWAPIEELQPHEWNQILNTNLTSTYLTVHYAVPHLKRAGGGSIVINSSVNGTRTFSNAGASAYSASKAGQIAFMKMIALELGRDNIRCNAVCPGNTRTNLGQRTWRRNTEEISLQIETPLGNPALHGGRGTPSDIADTCLFLVSDQSRHITGVEIYVDGGYSLLT